MAQDPRYAVLVAAALPSMLEHDRKQGDEAVEKYHAIEGGQQTLSNLAACVIEIVRKGVEG